MRSIPGVLLIVCIASTAVVCDLNSTSVAEESRNSTTALSEQVQQLRDERHLVALAAMVLLDGEIVESAATGKRQIGKDAAVEINDRWHLGSITKSITATMIARLIEDGKLDWDDTVADHFPDDPIHERWKNVTLHQLLTHTAGAPANFSLQTRMIHPAAGKETVEARKTAALEVLTSEPEYTPSEKYRYSNAGYAIAGAMAEQATGKTFNELVEQEVFAPLELTRTGFGPPQLSQQTVDQPTGHRTHAGLKVSVGDKADNTSIMAPGGGIHMPLESLCRFADAHLQGERDSHPLLTTESWRKLHTPELNNYACGWVKKDPSWKIPHTLFWHNGSNTMWYALVVFIPEKNMVIAVTTNDGDIKNSEAAAWEIVNARAAAYANERDFENRKSLPTQAFPKKAPFSAVRWKGKVPEVQVDGNWYTLLAIDGVESSDIIAFSQKHHGDKWQKRFSEDLFELMVRMGKEPGKTVSLTVRKPDASTTETLKDIPMTEQNRRLVREANSR